MERIFTKGMAFTDESGRNRIFNGANICSKNYHGIKMSERTEFPYTLDDYKWSQAYYCHSYFGEELLSALNRTYPVAVSGEIESFGMDREKNILLYLSNFTVGVDLVLGQQSKNQAY